MSAVDDYLRQVLRSGLLSREQMQNALRSLPVERREQVSAISDHLIAKGVLTRFQNFKLSQGITIGMILGPYRVLAPIGKGGMGTVYLATDTRSSQYVALKLLPPKVAREKERLLARFQREMELSQKIQHPHLARTLEVGVFHGIHYIAMEYIPGQTLYRLVTTYGILSIIQAANLFAEVASAIGHAHSQGVIHRDLKPSNIMVTPHGHAWVLDLGLAFTAGESVEDVEVVGGKGYIVGSVDYMAPEQTRDPTTIDARADLYGVGCCLYFALTGQPPFPSRTKLEKARAQRHEPPEPIRNSNPTVPEAFAAVVDRLMSKVPADRYGSAGEFAVALQAFRGGEVLPLDAPGDAEHAQSIRNVLDSWTPPEPAKDTVEDAVLLTAEDVGAEPEEAISRSIFSEIDRGRLLIWPLVLVAFWVVMVLACVLGWCVRSWLP